MTTLMPTGPAADALLELHDLIASCAEFQEACRTEADPEETAANFIHFPLQSFEVPNKFPFAVLTTLDFQEEQQADGLYLPKGVVHLSLGKRVTINDDPKRAEIDFGNFENAVIQDIKAASGTGGHRVWRLRQVLPPSNNDPRHVATGTVDNSAPHYYDVAYDCEWGAL